MDIKMSTGMALGNLFGNNNTECTVLIQGLDNAGKGTILRKLNEEVMTTMKINDNVRTIEFSNITFNWWDVGGRDKIRALMYQCYQKANALIWVIDACDRRRMEESFIEFSRTLTEVDGNIPVLIFCNKLDLLNAMDPSEIAEALPIPHHMSWHIQSCSAKTGDGLYEGLDWLLKEMNQKAQSSNKKELLKFDNFNDEKASSTSDGNKDPTLGQQISHVLNVLF